MKKIKYLAIATAMIFGMATANAQGVDNIFCFLDANGNEVKDGSTVTFHAEKKETIQGMPDYGFTLDAKFDLMVKNTAAAVMGVGAHVVTKNMSSGSLKFCFPNTCPPTIPADYTTDKRKVASGESIPLNSGWLPAEGTYGDADFTVQLMVYDYFKNVAGLDAYDFIGLGPKINIHCVYADPTGITDVEDDVNATEVARYDANGRMLTAPQKGLNIIKLSNGKTIKTVIK